MIHSAFINIWNERVGAIVWNQDREVADFEFEPSFIRKGLDISPLKLPIYQFKNKIYSFNDSGSKV